MKNKDCYDLRSVECVLISEDSFHEQTWEICMREGHHRRGLQIFRCSAFDSWLSCYNSWLEQESEYITE